MNVNVQQIIETQQRQMQSINGANALQICKDARCLEVVRRFGNAQNLAVAYTKGLQPYMSDAVQREKMVVSRNAPSVSVICKSFQTGRAAAENVVGFHLIKLATAVGVAYNDEVVQEVASNVVDAFGWMSLAQIAVALKYAREGQLRDAQGKNLAKMYGTLSGAVVADCLRAFNLQYRVPMLEKWEQAERKVRSAEEMKTAVTFEEWQKMKNQKQQE